MGLKLGLSEINNLNIGATKKTVTGEQSFSVSTPIEDCIEEGLNDEDFEEPDFDNDDSEFDYDDGNDEIEDSEEDDDSWEFEDEEDSYTYSDNEESEQESYIDPYDNDDEYEDDEYEEDEEYDDDIYGFEPQNENHSVTSKPKYDMDEDEENEDEFESEDSEEDEEYFDPYSDSEEGEEFDYDDDEDEEFDSEIVGEVNSNNDFKNAWDEEEFDNDDEEFEYDDNEEFDYDDGDEEFDSDYEGDEDFFEALEVEENGLENHSNENVLRIIENSEKSSQNNNIMSIKNIESFSEELSDEPMYWDDEEIEEKDNSENSSYNNANLYKCSSNETKSNLKDNNTDKFGNNNSFKPINTSDNRLKNKLYDKIEVDILYKEGMSLVDYIRACGGRVSIQTTKVYFSDEEIKKALSKYLVLKKNGYLIV